MTSKEGGEAGAPGSSGEKGLFGWYVKYMRRINKQSIKKKIIKNKLKKS